MSVSARWDGGRQTQTQAHVHTGPFARHLDLTTHARQRQRAMPIATYIARRDRADGRQAVADVQLIRLAPPRPPSILLRLRRCPSLVNASGTAREPTRASAACHARAPGAACQPSGRCEGSEASRPQAARHAVAMKAGSGRSRARLLPECLRWPNASAALRAPPRW